MEEKKLDDADKVNREGQVERRLENRKGQTNRKRLEKHIKEGE